MSAACKTILKRCTPGVQNRRLGHGEWPPALTRMFCARRNWPTLLRDGIRLVAKPQRKPQFPEAAFQAHGRPRHLPILGPYAFRVIAEALPPASLYRLASRH